jgi:hypothetical protein
VSAHPRACDKQCRRRHGDEVPVDVDEAVEQVRRQDQREREVRAAPAQAAAQQEDNRRAEEQEPDKPRLRQELHRQVVRLARHVEVAVAVAEVRHVKRARAGAGDRVVREAAPRLLPPRPAQVR